MELGHKGKRVGRGAVPVTQRCQSNSVCAALAAEGCQFPRVHRSLRGSLEEPWAKRLQLQLPVGVHVPVHVCACVCWGPVYLTVLITLSTARMMLRLRASGDTQL